ncbi:MAG: SusD/RagB family nutrient-binding outer membrane lipoprotein [Rhodothermaceae bacterium]|nr:SusD/RagB family nutrient-binding outer membrane lipoprotein [Bacteroidota bacterium]MXZ58587.1 SusD/RagB family nutrient-binding outer membrane lipoprotein [Rhodothermaceae bacterium]MYD67736.1 SusD/RagB family nutrient-binding outer membrane lipoprotein [Rhodothermaceae bacterium]MYJ08287.1 SusD/RagB family nutrient-binding outer membrane lipoprotein [Rhodothermaceae bacterium]
MTKLNRLSIAAALCLSLLIASCDSGFEEMNVNPTQASQIDPNFKLTNIQLRISGERYENWRTNLIYSSVMIQHFATLPGYWAGDKYGYIASYSAAMWDRYYPNIAKNIEDLLLQTAEDPEMANMHHITQIVRVIMYHRLTDLYGDIPYSEAGKGFIEGVTQPKYDAQSTIYPDMLAKLEAAAAGLSAGSPSFGGGDLLYQGDVEKWKRLANSLMLRLGMRLVKVDAGAAQSWVQKAIAGGTMESNDDIAYVPHNDPSGWRNGNGSVFLADRSPRISEFFANWMVEHNDPRLYVYGQTPVAGSDPIGMPNGRIAGGSDADHGIENHSSWVSCDSGAEPCGMDVYLVPNDVIKGQDDPMFFMTYAEVELLKAEAALRGWHSGDAATHYANGVRAAMEYLAMYGAAAAISSDDIDAYLAANPYDAANGMEMINTQLWAAVLLNEYEAFANWRRTGYPELTPVNYPGNVTGGTIPRRLRYRENEAVANPQNYSAAVSAQGPDELTTRVWWDK